VIVFLFIIFILIVYIILIFNEKNNKKYISFFKNFIFEYLFKDKDKIKDFLVNVYKEFNIFFNLVC
jgi:hypothetical protein